MKIISQKMMLALMAASLFCSSLYAPPKRRGASGVGGEEAAQSSEEEAPPAPKPAPKHRHIQPAPVATQGRTYGSAITTVIAAETRTAETVKILKTQVETLLATDEGDRYASSLPAEQLRILGNILQGFAWVSRNQKPIILMGILVLAGSLHTEQGAAVAEYVKARLIGTYGFFGRGLWQVGLGLKYMLFDLPVNQDTKPLMDMLSTWPGRVKFALTLLAAAEACTYYMDWNGGPVEIIYNKVVGPYVFGTIDKTTDRVLKFRDARFHRLLGGKEGGLDGA